MTPFRTLFLWLCCLLIPIVTLGEALNCPLVFQNQPGWARMSTSATKGRLPDGFDRTLFPETTAARIYVEMAQQGMLLSQNSQSLQERNLVSPNGGLCASTCITNLIGAMTAQYQNFRQFPARAPDITHWVVNVYNSYTGLDARMGANVNVMADILLGLYPQILDKLYYDSLLAQLDLQLHRFDEEIYVHRIFQAMRQDSLAIATVVAHKPHEFGSGDAHAIILLKVDTDKNQLYISDPNLPNEILRVPYRFHHGTDIVFNVPFTFGEHAVELRQVNIFRRILTDIK